ncbi:MAG TPA: DUF2277 domain-containing protein [Bryobacteraceae bacterium]|nr:DUF2277 domain-containing protein [Bryobacteraceae bacterium]
MCRSIKVLRVADQHATPEEISAAALQFVRKVSGYRKPSRANEQVFNQAIVEISHSVERLLEELAPSGAGSRPAHLRAANAASTPSGSPAK